MRFNVILILLFLICENVSAQTDYKTAKVKCYNGFDGYTSGVGSKQCTPDYGLSGSSEILSHYAYRGLSYSGDHPSIVSSFLYNFGAQFKIGAWGANLNLPDSNLWLKFVSEIQLKFADHHDVTVFIHRDYFYSNGDRNGTEIGINYFFLENYYMGLSTRDNFEGTKTSAEYLTFAYTSRFTKDFSFSYKLGYTSQHSQALTNYFNAKIALSYEMLTSTLETGLTDMTAKDKYSQKAEPHLYASILAYY